MNPTRRPDATLFRAQQAEEEVRKLREEVTLLRVKLLELTQRHQETRETLERERQFFVEDLKLAKELLEKLGALGDAGAV